ncbi:LLM class F420-dependent oxidoreductase [Nocardia brevicatena]|uniref:LLM class F420-dependent oxidoreductase n=1 Tax=Nocardia brevicatena TaxID=37327 RepID=UPI0002EC4B9D|nr:LLM class F420-dependent oxidoreductase [Nocardia brevicatena]
MVQRIRIGLLIGVVERLGEVGNRLAALEDVGLESVTVSEAYTFDAVSQLGFLAAWTRTVELATGILPVHTRTPTLLAMTAAGLDFASEGRFRLGLGASGPQVVDGFHGVDYVAPLSRISEAIDVCRAVWRREKLVHEGRRWVIPRTEGYPALKLIQKPVRTHIPITVAGTGPKTVRLAAAKADAWEPIFFHPGRAEEVWGADLAAGATERASDLSPLEIVARVPVAIGADTTAEFEKARAQLALYVGGMGSRKQNFYHDLAHRYGYGPEADRIQGHYLSGRVPEAVAAVPDEFVRATTLIGTPDDVAERLGVFQRAGLGLLTIQPMNEAPDRVAEAVRTLRAASDALAG